MFVVTKGEEKKNRFITHYEIPTIPHIKLDSIKPPKIQASPKKKKRRKKKEKNKLKKKKKKI